MRARSILGNGIAIAGPCFAQASQYGQVWRPRVNPRRKTTKPSQKDDKSAAPHTIRLRIRVTNSEDKPVGNASVYVRFNEAGGFLHKDKLAEMSFKTNEDGSVKVPAVPQAKF